MKLLAIFMSILLLITGFDLCEVQSMSGQKEKVEISKTEKDKPAADTCSPYCHCARCPFSGLPPAPLIRVQYFDVVPGYIVASYTGTPVQVSNSVWQPPKATRS